MADKLSVEQRLKQKNTRLKSSNEKLRSENRELKRELCVVKKELLLLSQKLDDKELQRKHLLEKLYKPNKKDGSKEKPLGKKPGAKGYHRPAPQEEDVTETRTYTPTRCPYCRLGDCLGEAQETVVKYQEDIVIIPEKIVKKHVITKHWCSHCKEYIRSDKVPPNIERLGSNVLAYILYARYRLRLPYNKIRQSLKDLHDFSISEGEIASQLEKGSEVFGKEYEDIKELIRISDTVYCDETGWRVKGKNFWIWVFVTSKGTRYVVEDTRGKGVAEKALGDNEDRVLISDFYAAYKNLPGENQYCWVHLLRDAKATETPLYEDLTDIYHELKEELIKEVEKRDYDRLDRLLQEIEKKLYKKAPPVVKTLQKRISKTREQLLMCLKYPDVLPENNTAERALRNNVVMRKIFGGSRSINHAKVMEVNTSVLDTLAQQHPDKGFFEVLLPKLKELRGEEDESSVEEV